MPSDSEKRYTQLDFGALRTHNPPHNERSRSDDNKSGVAVKRLGAVTSSNTAKSSGTQPVHLMNGYKPLKLPTSLQSRRVESKILKLESPWRWYEKLYELRLGDSDRVVVAEVNQPWSTKLNRAELQSPSPYVVTIKKFPANNAERKIHLLQRIQHDNIVAVREIFSYQDVVYPVYEHMPVSLSHFAGIQKALTEVQLASILGQLLDGLCYLNKEGLEHGSLTSSNVLVNSAGEVKLADQECCHTRVPGDRGARDIKAISSITMELIQKHVKDSGNVGIDDPSLLTSDSSAVAFLTETTSTTSLEILRKHPLFKVPWSKESLQGMVDLVMVIVFRGHKYPAI